MTVIETVVAYVGTSNNMVGEAVIVTSAMITFFMILEGFLYWMWKMATSRL